MPGAAAARVHFGGPDQAPRVLRDLLAERVAAVRPGGSIDWVTYYFRDRELARALIDAKRRGVEVRVSIEGAPRRAEANDAVRELLGGGSGLGEGFRSVVHTPIGLPGVRTWRPRLHEKLYCFSEPAAAFVGSFNPSGDGDELQPDVVAEIGDHDRGHNLLVELREPALVQGLVQHARDVHEGPHGWLERFARAAHPPLAAAGTELHFWPRTGAHPVAARLAALGANARVRIAASHVSGRFALSVIGGLAQRGASVELVGHATERRFPKEREAALREAGVQVRRLGSAEGPPMHDKFVLVEQGDERWASFGSFNFNEQSRRLNHEIAALTHDPAILSALDARWSQLR